MLKTLRLDQFHADYLTPCCRKEKQAVELVLLSNNGSQKILMCTCGKILKINHIKQTVTFIENQKVIDVTPKH